MNDYLWQKTGSDADIERLENLLGAFRHSANAAPPVIERAAVTATTRKWSFGWKLGFAFAAIVPIVASLIFVAVPSVPDKQAVPIAERMGTSEAITELLVSSENTSALASDPSRIGEPIVQIAPTPKRPVRAVFHRRHRRQAELKPEAIAVTSEEAAAYKKLMTALAITSEKLKIVKDKINGTEE